MKILLTLFVLFFSSSVFANEIDLLCKSKVNGTDNEEWKYYGERASLLKIDYKQQLITHTWEIDGYKLTSSLNIISNNDGKIRAVSNEWIDIPGVTSIAINMNSKIMSYVTSYAYDEKFSFTTWGGKCY